MKTNTTQYPSFKFTNPTEWVKFINHHAFEAFSSQLAQEIYSDATVIQTRFNNDGGVDFYSIDPLSNSAIFRGEAKRHKVAGLNEFSRSVVGALKSQNKKESTELVIITTSLINIHAYDEIHRVLSGNGIKFILLHCTSLFCFSFLQSFKNLYNDFELNKLISHQVPKNFHDLLVHYAYRIEKNDIKRSIESSTFNSAIPDEQNDIYELKEDENISLLILVENYSDTETEIEASFYRDEDWRISFSEDSGSNLKGTNNKFPIKGYGQVYLRCSMRLRHPCKTRIPSIVLRTSKSGESKKLKKSVKETTLLIEHKENKSVIPYYRLEFDESYYETNQIDTIESFLDGTSPDSGNVLYIEGDIGTGKSRLIEEVSNKSLNSPRVYCKLASNETDTEIMIKLLESLLQYTVRPSNVVKPDKSSLLKDLLKSERYSALWKKELPLSTYVFIDDLHLASNNFLSHLVTLISQCKNSNIYFSLIATKGYRTYDEKYSSYINELDLKNNKITLEPFEEKSIKKIIETILPGIGSKAAHQISQLSDSNIVHIFSTIEHIYKKPISVLAASKSYISLDERLLYSNSALPKLIKKTSKTK